MATVESLDLRVSTLEQNLADLIANSKTASELTGAQRNPIKDSIYPLIQGYRTDKGTNQDYSNFEVGDIVDHIDKVARRKIAGEILQVPFTAPTDFDNRNKFDSYEDSKPAVNI